MPEPISLTVLNTISSVLSHSRDLYQARKTPDEVRTCLSLLEIVDTDLKNLISLRSANITSLTTELTTVSRLDHVIASAADALLGAGRLLKEIRKEADSGNEPAIGKARWVLSDTTAITQRVVILQQAHESVLAEIQAFVIKKEVGETKELVKGEAWENTELLRTRRDIGKGTKESLIEQGKIVRSDSRAGTSTSSFYDNDFFDNHNDKKDSDSNRSASPVSLLVNDHITPPLDPESAFYGELRRDAEAIGRRQAGRRIQAPLISISSDGRMPESTDMSSGNTAAIESTNSNQFGDDFDDSKLRRRKVLNSLGVDTPNIGSTEIPKISHQNNLLPPIKRQFNQSSETDKRFTFPHLILRKSGPKISHGSCTECRRRKQKVSHIS
jgi:hypothetical protein